MECLECGGIVQMNDKNGDYVCIECGLIDSTSLILKEPKHSLKNPTTEGPFNLLFRPITTATKIEAFKEKNKDKRRIYRLDQITNAKDTTIQIWISNMEKTFKDLSIPQVVQKESVKEFVRLIRTKQFKSNHRNYNAYFAASVYFFGRQYKYYYNLQQLIEKFGASTKCTNFSIRSLRKIPHIPRNIDLIALIHRYCETYNVQPYIRSQAILLLEKYEKKYPISGKNPQGIVGAIILYTCNRMGITIEKKELVSEINITQVTIRNRVLELEKTNKQYKIFKNDGNPNLLTITQLSRKKQKQDSL